jgi:kynureninase
MAYDFEMGIDCAKKMDLDDSLRDMKKRFYVQEGQIYMDGNSLGVCSKDAEAAILDVLEVWKRDGINIWNVRDSKFFLYPSYLGARLAKLINAESNEVTVTNSTTINIHQGLASFYKPTKERYKILVDDLNFPTDRHAVDSQVRLHGYAPEDAVKVVPSPDGRLISEDAVIEAMTDDVALILLPSLLYRSSQLVDMQRITDEAKRRGIIIGWDLCHSIGAVPHDFKKIDPDFAVWCNYKYLAGGPGAIAGLYINKRHFGELPGMAGWHGNVKDTQFQLNHKHENAPDADGWLTGTAPLLSMAALDGVLDIYDEAKMERIRKKSLTLTAYMMYLIDSKLIKYGCAIGNPRDDEKRGGHVSLEHDEAYRICQALKTKNVVPDFREPNVVRLAPVALYVSYEDVYRLIDIIEEILKTKDYENYSTTRTLVT